MTDIQYRIVEHEKALEGAVVSFADELEALRVTSKVQNYIYGLGLEVEELLARFGEDVKLLEAARQIHEEIGNKTDAQKFARAIESILAPDSRAEIQRLRKQMSDIQSFIINSSGKMSAGIARKLDSNFKGHDMSGFLVSLS